MHLIILVFPVSLCSSCRLVVPNKGYSSLDQSPDEKPLVALDTDRYDEPRTNFFDVQKVTIWILRLSASCDGALIRGVTWESCLTEGIPKKIQMG